MINGRPLHAFNGDWHRPSAYYRDLGCTHPDCVHAKSTKRTMVRARHWRARQQVNGRWVNPLLAPTDSTQAARHGTYYGRVEFGCECDPCLQASRRRRRRRSPAVCLFAPGINPHVNWVLTHLAVWGSVFPLPIIAAVTCYMIWRHRMNTVVHMVGAHGITGYRSVCALLALAVVFAIGGATQNLTHTLKIHRPRRDTIWISNQTSFGYHGASKAAHSNSPATAAAQPHPSAPPHAVSAAPTALALAHPSRTSGFAR